MAKVTNHSSGVWTMF